MNNIGVVALALILTPFADQAIKYGVRRWLRGRSVPLAGFGRICVVQTRMWNLRIRPMWSLRTVWLLWTLAAAAAVIASVFIPSLTWALALIVGASLSHAIETSWRGSICDYLCLRFWPAFNLADVVLTIGAAGLAYELIQWV